jgi:hypothetical protein
MGEKNHHKNSCPDNEQRPDEPDLASSLLYSWKKHGPGLLGKSMDPAPIDIVAFGKRLAEIITKAVRPSRKRHKSRK